MRAVIGIDYGTQSARAILVNAENGEVLCSHSVSHPHGIWEGGLVSADDYEAALYQLLEAVTPEEYKKDIEGICVDATSLTLVPMAADGRVLSQLPGMTERHHAQIKLWKYHGAQTQAEEALALAKELGEKFLGRTGGSLSCEWTLPKLLQIRDEDPESYAQIDIALDLCEFLTLRLTGKITRSVAAMGFKGLWFEDLGFPSDEFLNGIRPGFAEEYKNLMRGTVARPGDKMGYLKPELRQKLGLREDVAVATGTIDGHTSLVAMGAMEKGDAALVVGTSNVVTVQMERMCELEGICGVVKDGLAPGVYGLEGGQGCTGDMLDWYLKNMLGGEIQKEAKDRDVSPHQVLMEKVKNPWTNEVVVADWWNGSRNMPCDLSLRGTIYGLSLNTRAEDIYLALLQSIVCGTREILEKLEESGIAVTKVLATGGITKKNPLLMQEYANLLNRTIYVGQVSEGPALGSAIFAAVAAGIYENPMDAYAHMGIKEFITYEPDSEHRAEYEVLYRKNHDLRVRNS